MPQSEPKKPTIPRPRPREEVHQLSDEEIEFIDEKPSGIHSVPPPPSAEKAAFSELDHAMLQHDRVIEAETVRLIDGITATFTMEKSSKREDSERNEDNIFIHEDPELGPMAGVADGLGGEGEKGAGALASEKIVAVLPMRLQDAYDAIRGASSEALREAAEKLSIVVRNAENKDLMHAKTPEQKRSALLLETHPDIARKAIAISEALKTANADVRASGGQTTVSFSVIHIAEDGKRFAITANIGDSGTLLRKANGDVEMVTVEDAALDYLRQAGRISDALLEDMRSHPGVEFAIPGLRKPASYKKLKLSNTQALGGPEVDPRITVTELEAGDAIIAATDGYFDFLEQDGELNLNAIKGALSERSSTARMNGLREIARVMSLLQKQEGENLKEPDDMAAVELSV